jgi:hypothetical protein
MKNATVVATAALLGVLSSRALPDVSLSLIEYRVLGQIGQVRVTTGFVHDPETQRSMLARLASFDQQGLILVAGDSVREFRRRETIGSHSVETTIHVYPAVGHGYRGGLATADIIVTVDGKKTIDCPYDSGPVELADIVVSPVDGTISVSGSYDDKRIQRVVLLNGGPTIDLPWMQRNAR